MLSTADRSLIYDHAYVPEHLPDYVEAISGAGAFFHEAHICYLKGRHLIFVGYAMPAEASDTAKAYESACRRFDPVTVAIVAPRIWSAVEQDPSQSEDTYYLLDLPAKPPRPDVAYMIRRASRELEVSEGSFGEEHISMVDAFIAARDLLSGHQEIFRSLPAYLERSGTAILLEARRRGELIAFNVLDLGSRDWAFWLFNFRSAVAVVPGASDLLFYEMVRVAEAKGKKRLNLGLGINAGVRRFKEKWGAVAFLSYVTASVRRKRMDVFRVLTGL